MTTEEAISQLQSLIDDAETHRDPDGHLDDVFEKDVEALKIGISALKTEEFKANYLRGKKEPPKSRVERMFGVKENWRKDEQSAPTLLPEQKDTQEQDGYKGFLLMRCQHCGKVKGLCAKNPIRQYICNECSETTPLDSMIPAYVRCEKCGCRFRYRSNIDTHELISFSCLNCHAPIDLQLNKKGTKILNV